MNTATLDKLDRLGYPAYAALEALVERETGRKVQLRAPGADTNAVKLFSKWAAVVHFYIRVPGQRELLHHMIDSRVVDDYMRERVPSWPMRRPVVPMNPSQEN